VDRLLELLLLLKLPELLRLCVLSQLAHCLHLRLETHVWLVVQGSRTMVKNTQTYFSALPWGYNFGPFNFLSSFCAYVFLGYLLETSSGPGVLCWRYLHLLSRHLQLCWRPVRPSCWYLVDMSVAQSTCATAGNCDAKPSPLLQNDTVPTACPVCLVSDRHVVSLFPFSLDKAQPNEDVRTRSPNLYTTRTRCTAQSGYLDRHFEELMQIP
jgi:hypothetical protein